MATRTVYVDDYDGSELGEHAKPVVLALDGVTYSIHLSAESRAKLDEALLPFIGNADKTTVNGSQKRATASAGGSAVNNHGYDPKDVREWAIATGQRAKNGKVITADTKRLHQGIYDSYKAAH